MVFIAGQACRVAGTGDTVRDGVVAETTLSSIEIVLQLTLQANRLPLAQQATDLLETGSTSGVTGQEVPVPALGT